MGPWLRLQALLAWRRLTWCFAFGVGPADGQGLYPALFCDRLPLHRGDHRDSRHGISWPRTTP